MDVVDACAGAAHRLERGAEVEFMQILRTNKNRLRVLRFLYHRVALGRKALQADLRDVVDHQNLALPWLSRAALRTPSYTRRACTRPPWSWRCRCTRSARPPTHPLSL